MARVTWRGIVKVQRSLYENQGAAGSTVLINSKDHSIFYMGPIDRFIKPWFTRRGHQHKFFAHAELVGTLINLVRKAPWQDW